MSKRYVIFAEKYGVYLGTGLWSKGGRADEHDEAPTFEEGTPVQSVLSSLPQELGLELREVIPDRPGHRASMDRLAEIGLPRWGKEGAPESTTAHETVKGEVGGKKKRGKKE